MDKKGYTTGQIGKFCNVFPRTVCKWIDSGKLLGYRDKSNVRRVFAQDLRRFLDHHGFPIPEELQDKATKASDSA